MNLPDSYLIDGAHPITAMDRLARAVETLDDGTSQWWRKWPLTFRNWPDLLADRDIAERIDFLIRTVDARHRGMVLARIEGTTLEDSITAAAEPPAGGGNYRSIVAALMAGAIQVVAVGGDASYTLTVRSGWTVSGLAAVTPAHRREVAAALRRAADTLAPDDKRCPLCKERPPLRLEEWPDHILNEHGYAPGAHGLTGRNAR